MASFFDELNLCSDLSTLGEKVNYIMSGSDDNSTVIDDDWQHLNHGARTSFLNALNEDFGSKSFSDFLAENENVGHPWKSENQTLGASIKMEEGEAGVNSFTDVSLQPNHFSAFTSPGGLAERMAAKKGFSLPKIDTARISPNSMVSSTDIQSPYFTIPPGLSPTLLLESPVFLSDSLGQLSPTRGKFHFSENVALNPLSVPYAKDEADLFEEIPETFTFKPLPESHLHLLSSEKKLPSIELPNLPEKPSEQAVNIAVANKNFQDPQDFNLQACSSLPSDRKEATINVMINPRVSESFVSNDNFPAINDQHDEEANPKGDPSAALGTPAEDGYNWRKYGQKQVKGSEFPRSYYKCTHPSCQVKKKVERSHEGHITEIIYKGNHNHPQPNMHRRPSLPSSHPVNDTQIDGSEQPESQTSYDGKPIKGSSQSGNGGQDWLGDGLEASSSAPAAVDYYNHSSSLQQNQDGTRLSPDIIRVSSTMSNNDEDDDQATLGSVSQGCDGEGDETESKKMKLDACAIDMSAASRAVREPRVVVQTTSEVDILDDGYRWRKYGQKVVKGNPNPRSYYKCTNPGCIVRKHIERASHDLKSVITTYEGKHNHDVPAARGGSHPQSVPCSTTSNSVTQPHNLLQRHEPAQDALVRFDGHSSLSTFSFPGRDQLGTKASFPYAMAPPGFPSLSMVGLAPMAPTKMPILPPIHPYVSHLQPTEAGFMMPKMEHKEGAATELMPPVPNAASLYHQMMSRLPLGPQL